MNNPDHISERLETIFRVRILEYFDADRDPGIRNLFYSGSGILDPGWKKFGSGINIPIQNTDIFIKTCFGQVFF